MVERGLGSVQVERGKQPMLCSLKTHLNIGADLRAPPSAVAVLGELSQATVQPSAIAIAFINRAAPVAAFLAEAFSGAHFISGLSVRLSQTVSGGLAASKARGTKT